MCGQQHGAPYPLVDEHKRRCVAGGQVERHASRSAARYAGSGGVVASPPSAHHYRIFDALGNRHAPSAPRRITSLAPQLQEKTQWGRPATTSPDPRPAHTRRRDEYTTTRARSGLGLGAYRHHIVSGTRSAEGFEGAHESQNPRLVSNKPDKVLHGPHQFQTQFHRGSDVSSNKIRRAH